MLRSAVVVATLVLIPASSLADDSAPPLDWSKHMGKLAFAVGYERGMKEVAFTGKAPMFFFTSSKDPWCPKYAARTFTDAKFDNWNVNGGIQAWAERIDPDVPTY